MINSDKNNAQHSCLMPKPFEKSAYSEYDTLHGLFEQQVLKTPNNLALAYDSVWLTYQALNDEANQLAHYLRHTYPLQGDDLIALQLGRSEKMWIAILAVLKAGAAYVPLDPSYPSERINYILSDTKAKVLISVENNCFTINGQSIKKSIAAQSTSNPKHMTHARNLAYVIYTSGTSGQPKGVMIEHRGLVNLAKAQAELFQFNTAQKPLNILGYANYVFDAHAFEAFTTLIHGHALYLIEESARNDFELLAHFIARHHIAIAILPPVLLNNESKVLPLKWLVVGGDKTNLEVYERYRAHHIPVINAYGPTEATVCATINVYKNNGANTIGKPLPHVKAYVLDDQLTQVSYGTVGELYLGGIGLARGYLNNPELTAEKFIKHSFATDERLYKTGDLARVLPDGNIEFIGRSDLQIKIRGYRIEPGEIESTIVSYPGIKQALVLAQGEENKYLIAYYASKQPVDENALIKHLANHLPDYMCPHRLIHVEKMPLTLNGKIDRKALPDPHSVNQTVLVKPRTGIETQIFKIWSEVLDLDPEQFGINNDFFRLGGNSISAVKIIHKINNNCAVNLKFSDFMRDLSIEKLALRINQLVQCKEKILGPARLADSYSTMESLILNHLLILGKDSIVYNESFVIEDFNKDYTYNSFENFVKEISDKIEWLHANYVISDSKMVRVLNPSVIPCQRLMVKSGNELALMLDELVKIPFNLAADKLIRFYYLENLSGKNKIFIVLHHLIADATSLYNLLTPMLMNEPIAKDFLSTHLTSTAYLNAIAEIRRVYQENHSKKKDFWTQKLSQFEPIVLPHPDMNAPTQGAQVSFTIDSAIYSTLKAEIKDKGINLFSILLAHFGLTLTKYYYTDQTLITTNIDERLLAPQYSDTFGCLINHVLVPIAHNPEETLLDFVVNTRRGFFEAIEHTIGYDEILALNREKALSFQRIHFNLEAQELRDYHYKQSQIYTHSGTIKNDLYFEMDAKADHLLGRVEYNSQIFSKEFVQEFVATYKLLLTNYAHNLNKKIKDISYLEQGTYKKIIYDWNTSPKRYPANKTIPQLFEEQVLKTPHAIAVVYKDIQLTYQALNSKANQLAHYLRAEYKVKGDDFVALLFDRSELMIIAILGVLKSGAAYVPIDPSFPLDRINTILTDTQVKAKITRETLSVAALLAQSTLNPAHSITPDNLAYVIYTSGTTGRPKGVMQEHKNVHRLFSATESIYQFNQHDVWVLFHSYIFDFTVWEIWGALFFGGKLLVPSTETLQNLTEFYDLCVFHKVTVINQTPKIFYELINIALTKKAKLAHLRYLIFGGEVVNYSRLIPWLNLYQDTHAQLINVYGITETTVLSTYQSIQKNDINKGAIIGKLFPDQKAYILDRQQQPVPLGAIGELYIGGAGLSPGYLNNPELTAGKFIDNPFCEHTRLYKTGDLVRYLPDRRLEYIGRADFQVKIRGFRIELGEIEARLLSYSGIKEAVVVTQGNESKYLVGYYVAEQTIEEASIHQYLSQYLPEYMLPAVLIKLNQLPLTINGKLDRSALPPAQFTDPNTYEPPKNELEKQFVSIWAEVLEIKAETLGVTDDFFRLGGNSILAIKLVNRLKSLGYTLTIKDIFIKKNIKNITSTLDFTQKQIALVKQPFKNETDQVLSFAQERLWFIAAFEQKSSAYNIPLIFKLENMDKDKLTYSLEKVVDRHEVLRTLIHEDKGKTYQKVYALADKALPIKTKSVNDIKQLNKAIAHDSYHHFNLGKEYPIRIGYYEMENSNIHYLSIVFHHIACDGWSLNVLANELYHFYRDSVSKLSEPSIQYKDFSLWQRHYLTTDVLSAQLAYWKKKLLGFELLNLPTDYPRPKLIDYKGSHVYASLDSETSHQLRRLAKELNVSLNSVLLSAYYLFLKSYSNQNDLVIGMPVANRHYPNVDNLIGLFVNTLALRSIVDVNESVISYIKSIGKNVQDAQMHQDLPFEKLVAELSLERDPGRHPIFQTLFSLQNFEVSYLPGMAQYKAKYNIAKFDLTTLIAQNTESLQIEMGYAKSLFKAETIKRYMKTYLFILKQMAQLDSYSKLKLSQINYLDNKAYKKIIVDWNATQKKFPAHNTLHQLFEEQVHNTPNHKAVVYNDFELTYSELNHKANQLAHYLRNTYHLQGDDLIALQLGRSEKMLIAILGVLKSGAAYVPIDPCYPVDRIDYILADTKAKAVIGSLGNDLTIHGKSIEKLLSQQSSSNLDHISTSNNLAYVIYTSGTTGKPKGVMVEHSGLVNLALAQAEVFKFNHTAKPLNILAYANYVFDAHAFEIFTTLIHGQTLYLVDNSLRNDIEHLAHYIKVRDVAIATMPPALLTKASTLLPLKTLVVAGDKTPLDVFNTYTAQGIPIINAYGPTEVSVCASMYYYDRNNINTIGKPIANLTSYVLDDALRPVPLNAVGELYLGGVGLARGYLNNPELTAEKFIKSPFASDARLYKTGDLARYLPDGNIEYIARADLQLKIRGFRIEPAEIEACLVNYPGINQAVVIAQQHTQQLVGYYVSGDVIAVEAITHYLATYLPDYMVPTLFVRLEKIPLTVTGKIDRAALPAAELTSSAYVAPESDIEKQLVALWAELLGLDSHKISTHDDFFRLGGESIKSIQLVSLLRQRLNIYITTKDIFLNKTIAQLYQNVILPKIGQNNASVMINEKGLLSGELGLLPIQAWFFDKVNQQQFKAPHHWNQSFLIKTQDLNVEVLQLSLNQLVAYHDALRINYKKDKTRGVMQYYNAQKQVQRVQVLDLKKLKNPELELEAILTAWQNHFNLFEDKPLYSCGYITGYPDGSSRIFFAAHHLIIDAVSCRIIQSDLMQLYNHYSLSKKSKTTETLLGSKGASYRIWVAAVNDYQKQHELEAHYWADMMTDVAHYNIKLLQCIEKNRQFSKASIELDIENIHQLLKRIPSNVEMNTVLLTAFNCALSEITRCNTNYITLEGHGREPINDNIDINHTVGWFTTLFPIRLTAQKELSASVFATQHQLNHVQNKGLGFGPLMGYGHLPKIFFNYLGEFQHITLESSGLSMALANQDDYIIAVNGYVTQGKLCFHLSAQLCQAQMDKLATLFLKQLNQISQAVSLSQDNRHVMQHVVDDWLIKHKALGASVRIHTADTQQVVTSGTLQLHSSRPINPDTLYAVGSLTKIFTSAMILRLEAQGKLSIDDKLAHYFPHYPRWKDITIKQLLNMTSGIFNFTEDPVWIKSFENHFKDPWQSDDLINLAYKQNDLCSPGLEWHYSNTNYELLGKIITLVTGQSLSTAYNENFIQPLGLSETYFTQECYPAKVLAKVAHGYVDHDDMTAHILTQSISNMGAASGGMLMSSADIEKWVSHLFIKKDVLPQAQLDKMLSGVVTQDTLLGFSNHRFGLGIDMDSHEKLGEIISYVSIFPGLGSTFLWLPRKNTLIIAQINLNNVSGKSTYLHFPGQELIQTLLENCS